MLSNPQELLGEQGFALKSFFALYHPQLVLPQLWLLYGGGILKGKILVRNDTAYKVVSVPSCDRFKYGPKDKCGAI